MKHFVAYSSEDRVHAATIAKAAQDATAPPIEYAVWSSHDGSGEQVDRAIESWVDAAEAFVCDVTFVNDNVTYELGYAIGKGKHIRLIRNSTIENAVFKQIGLLDTLLYDSFKTRSDLTRILSGRVAPSNKWLRQQPNYRQPIYVLSPPTPSSFATRLFSAVKKRTRLKFRSFKTWEIGRLTATEAWEQTASSFGIVVTWRDGGDLDSRRNNQRAALIFGMATALEIPALLLAQERSRLPSDLQAKATRFRHDVELDQILVAFRDDVADALNESQEEPELPTALLDSVYCGDPAAKSN